MANFSMHTHTCGELRTTDLGSEVTLTGWVWRRRDHGGLIFIDLRDREGLTQVSFDPDISGEAFHIAETVRTEWPLKVVGVVRERLAGGRVRVEQRNRISDGDVIEVLSPNSLGVSFIARHMTNVDGNPLDVVAVPQTIFVMDAPEGVGAGDILRVRIRDRR